MRQAHRLFNPQIDRYDMDSAVLHFERFWKNVATRHESLSLIAKSVLSAHDAAPSSWSITVFPNFLRLNVGLVEVLAVHPKQARILFSAQLDPHISSDIEIIYGDPAPIVTTRNASDAWRTL